MRYVWCLYSQSCNLGSAAENDGEQEVRVHDTRKLWSPYDLWPASKKVGPGDHVHLAQLFLLAASPRIHDWSNSFFPKSSSSTFKIWRQIGGFGGQIYWQGGGQVGVEATRCLPKFNTFSNNGVWESKSYSVHIGYNLVYIFSSWQGRYGERSRKIYVAINSENKGWQRTLGSWTSNNEFSTGDQIIISGLQIFLDHRPSRTLDQNILITLPSLPPLSIFLSSFILCLLGRCRAKIGYHRSMVF